MRAFEMVSAVTPDAAIAESKGGRFIGGGTTLLDLMKLDVMRPEKLVDITVMQAFSGVEITDDTVRFGALTRMSEAAGNAKVRQHYPVLAETLSLAASQQLRNMARLGGNVLQRTRCSYFRDARNAQCNKRDPGSGCAALDGNSRALAILGTSTHCIASYPGDWAQALIALDADVEILAASGPKRIKFADLHRLPGETPHLETNLAEDDLITGFVVQGGPWPRSRYVKVRDRESYEFGVATAAVALKLDGDKVLEARIGLGGVATVPWRPKAAEASLQGKALDEQTAAEAAEIAFIDARVTADNAFKLPLGKATLIRALLEAKEMRI
jgi:xanthine dehydrogenase YagS FAD-binding subunit